MGLEDLDNKIMKEASDLEANLNLDDLHRDEPPLRGRIWHAGMPFEWAHVIMYEWAHMCKPDRPIFSAAQAKKHAEAAEAGAA